MVIIELDPGTSTSAAAVLRGGTAARFPDGTATRTDTGQGGAACSSHRPSRDKRGLGARLSAYTRALLSGVAVLASALVLGGCFGIQIYPTLQERVIALRAGDLETSGIAFVTPSAATGQEEHKQAVALVFAEVLMRERPGVRVVPLAEALGAINRAGLADAYKRMYDDYRDTGLFKREILGEVGGATGTRYIAQIKLQGFGQGAKERFGALGLRIVETKYANVRLFFQIWDSREGIIAWEAMQEMHYSRDTVTEEQVTLRMVVEHTARQLVARLP